MKVVFSWLKEFVDFDGSPDELADLLTMKGIEVEGVEFVGEELDDVVIGEILSIDPHPNADRLSLCKVDVGDEVLEIICGAKNIFVGAKVPVAKIGARLPNGMKIKKSKIRGVYSYGMLCSGEELGIEEKSEGIFILDNDSPKGKPITEYLPLKDAVLDVSITPNRGDCLSILGIAREVSAFLGLPLRFPDFSIDYVDGSLENLFTVKIDDPDGCMRYVAMGVEGVNISDSPVFIKRRLELSGMRPINNVVDITNYVMLELGQPLHAFDWDRLRKDKIIVRRAFDGESLTTLDGIERSFSSQDLLICDGEGPVAIAGVMGGENSEVSSETKRILLESASFNPTYIRKTSRRLGLTTEASYRFERGVDPELPPIAAKRACYLMSLYASGKVLRGYIDNVAKKIEKKKVFLGKNDVERVIGVKIEEDFIKKSLSSLGIDINVKEDGFYCTIPTWRFDLSIKEDLIEEVARLYGYENIAPQLPRISSSPNVNRKYVLRRRIREFFSSLGFNEVINYSFTRLDYLKAFGNNPIPLVNPLSEEMAYLRVSILPSLIQCLSKNTRFGIKSHRYFELRKVFSKDGGFSEKEHIGLLLSGNRFSCGLYSGNFDFYDLKGFIEAFFNHFHIDSISFEPYSFPFLIPGASSKILLGDKLIGIAGQLSPDLKDIFDFDVDVFVSEIFLEDIYDFLDASISFKPYSKFPIVWMDLALVMDRNFYVGKIVSFIKEVGSKYKVLKCDVVDVYEGKPLPSGKKSVTIRIFYHDMRKTLTDEEVSKLHTSLSHKIKDMFNLEFR